MAGFRGALLLSVIVCGVSLFNSGAAKAADPCPDPIMATGNSNSVMLECLNFLATKIQQMQLDIKRVERRLDASSNTVVKASKETAKADGDEESEEDAAAADTKEILQRLHSLQYLLKRIDRRVAR